MKNFKIFLLVIFGVSLIYVAKPFLLNSANAQSTDSEATDAIAVRILPNPNHYSIARWYESQGFSGAPQALVVDGYEAVRDGRTVYINATNVDGKNIYTNVYLISYNQSSAAKTVDILGQIVSHWKFNSNLGILESTNPVPSCAISNKNCLTSSDCGEDQICVNSGDASSSCILKTSKNCLIDSECPANFFCNSLKSKIIRDAKRIGQIEELKEALFKYKSKVVNNHFPILNSGTYIANHSVSVWPSWSQNLLANLGASGNFFDPINRLGNCPGYDIKTCWNNISNKFFSSPSQNSLMLPPSSYAFVYKTDAQGLSYNLCTIFETRDTSLNYKFSPNDPVSNVCVADAGTGPTDPTVNTPPVLVNKFLSGQTGQEFNGYFEVSDKENDFLTWTLYTNGVAWKNWLNDGVVNSAPILKNSDNLNQKKVYASLAGDPGDYTIGLRVDDGKGGILSTSSVIKITNVAPSIEADNATYVLSSYNPFSYNFSFSDNNLDKPENSYLVTKLSGPFDLWDESKTITFIQSDSNTYKVTHSSIISTTHKLSQDTDFTYRIKVTDKYGLATTKDIAIKVVVEKPILDFNCPPKTRLGKSYSCVLGSAVSNSRKDIIYSSENSAYNIYITKSSSSVFSIGAPVWNLSNLATSIIATDEYGATSSRAFSLIANNYCGDGKIQFPNAEGQGGPYNNGYESCDGLDGTTNIVASSSPTLQYACSTQVGEITPDIITTQSYCRFPSPLNGGGYCGDGYCSSIDGGGLETPCNCPNDCGTSIDCTYKPVAECGNGIIDPGEECDGADLGGRICESYLLNPNGISCTSDCKFNTRECSTIESWDGFYKIGEIFYPCAVGTASQGVPNNYNSCPTCPSGTYAAGTNSWVCTGCATGYYSLPGAASCSRVTTTCQDGYYASGTSCLPCTAGYYCFGGYGRAACPGGYTGPVGIKSKESCTICPENTYSLPGSSSCTACPDGYFSSPGNYFCTMIACEPGYYFTGTTCSVCPAGKYCTGCALHWVGVNCSANYTSPCPTDFTSLPGSKAEGDCFLNCPAGTLPMLGSTKISDCYADPGW